MRTGTGTFLIAAGAVLRFAVAAGSPHGLNVHVVGVVLILAGVLGLLLLPLLARGGPLNPPADPFGPLRRLRRLARREKEEGCSRECRGRPGERPDRQPGYARTPGERSLNQAPVVTRCA